MYPPKAPGGSGAVLPCARPVRFSGARRAGRLVYTETVTVRGSLFRMFALRNVDPTFDPVVSALVRMHWRSTPVILIMEAPMGWLSTEYRYRVAVTVDCSGGGGVVGVVTSIPGDWDHFWSVILPSGIDVVVTGADGVTVLAYERSFPGARSLMLTIGPVSLPETGAHVLWVYYGNPAETADRAVPVSVSSPKLGHIEVAAPATWRRYAPERWGALLPREKVSIKPVEVIDVHVGAWPLAVHASGYRPQDEEIRLVSVTTSTGAETVSILDQSAVRIMEIDGEPVVSVRLSEPPAGDYLLTVRATTTRGQALDWRAAVTSRDVSAP